MPIVTMLILGLSVPLTALSVAQAAGQSGNSPASPSQLKGTIQPKPGIIYIKGKRFTTCTDWGKDKGWCSKNQ